MGAQRRHATAISHARGTLIDVVVGVVVGLGGLVGVGRAAPPVAADASITGSSVAPVGDAYVPVGPVRVLDTRLLGPRPPAGTTLEISLSDRAGVPAGADAAALTITATDPAAPGYVTAWGDGARPATSTLNLDEPAQTRANAAIVPVGIDGSVRLFTQTGAHLVVDLTGVFTSSGPAAAGRFEPLGPARLLDTRAPDAPLAAHEVRTVDVAALGVPRDAMAVAVEMTGIAPDAWFAAWPDGAAWPGTSTVHTGRSGAPITAPAIVPLHDGRLRITGSATGHVVLDVTGWFTGPSAPTSADGLFVPVTPTRITDTRGDHLTSPPVEAGGTLDLHRFPFDVRSAGAVAVNVTTVQPLADGFVTAWPATTPRPTASVANVERADVVAAGAIVPASVEGIAVFTQAPAHLVVDVTGWFTTATRSLVPLPAPVPNANTNYAFMLVRSDGTWARWDPCRPVEIAVDFSGAGPGARAALASVVAEAGLATGIDLDVVETTVDGTPIDGAIGVRWADTDAVPALAGDVIGLGGFAATSERIVWGTVVIRSDVELGPQPGGDDLLRFVLAHEIGHALGLGHVGDAAQLMYPYATGLDRYQDGDRTGLALVGSASGCAAPRRTESIDPTPSAITVVHDTLAVTEG